MYESHFGLKKRPFRALALGNDVFIGPQAAAAISGVKKALGNADAILAVGGPVGTGKTTLVMKALGGLGNALVTISVGRIKLGHDEVLELLLQELGVEDLPPGIVQRFGLFRRLLKSHAEKGSRVCVVVEDAARIGIDAIAELEALTAADAGASDGANIILMGDETLADLIAKDGLSRVRQRLRLRHNLDPLTPGELLAYLKHCFRLAGGEFDAIFSADSAALLHELTAGVPRMVNNVVESAMSTAVESNLSKVDEAIIAQVARNEYGLATDKAFKPQEPAAAKPDMAVPDKEQPELNPVPATAQVSETAPKPKSAPDPETAAKPEPRLAPAVLPPDPAIETEAAAEDDDEIPELIQDTLPDLVVLAPQLMEEPRVTSASNHPRQSEPAVQHSTADAPSLSLELEPPVGKAPESASKAPEIPTLKANTEGPDAPLVPEDVPDWDRDPTLAELRPDLEALENAMAVAQGADDKIIPKTDEPPVLKPPPVLPPGGVPEITLDREIQAKIEEAAEAIRRTEAQAVAKAEEDARTAKSIDIAATGEIRMELPPLRRAETAPAADKAAKPAADSAAKPAADNGAKPAAAAPAEKPRKQDPEMQKIAANLARAKTLDDVDDKMAETLFGEEFSAIAAEVAAMAANDPSGDDEELPELALEEPEAAPAPPVNPASPKAGKHLPPKASGPVPGHGPGLDEAASKRLATVRALNGNKSAPPLMQPGESIVLKQDQGHPQPPVTHGPIESIEDQINTSMTATLQALGGKLPVPDDDDDDEKRGFFSRFRK